MKSAYSTRVEIPEVVKREVSAFYGGLQCVVTDAGHCFHHLDGCPGNSIFPNLIPLTLDLHRGIRKGKELPEELGFDLAFEPLKTKALDHFKYGRVTRAFGCMRLAFALSTHYLVQPDENEFQIAAHCLYFLRRSIGYAPPDLVYSNLQYILTTEIAESLQAKKAIDPRGNFSLLVELASWLNEFRQPAPALQMLKKAGNLLEPIKNQLAFADVARFHRQLANCLIGSFRFGKDLDRALELSRPVKMGSDNSEFAHYTTLLNYHIARDETKKALHVLKPRFEYFEDETDYCFGDLKQVQLTLQTSLGYMLQSIIFEGQVANTHSHLRKIKDRIAALKMQETRYGIVARLNSIPGLDFAVAKACRNFPELKLMVENRVFPALPPKLTEILIEIAVRL